MYPLADFLWLVTPYDGVLGTCLEAIAHGCLVKGAAGPLIEEVYRVTDS
jgi:hypothetical protein